METAASRVTDAATWKVSSDGAPVAHVASQRDGAGVLVTAQFFGSDAGAERIRPYRFDDARAADAFVGELVASFSYLGCHVARP